MYKEKIKDEPRSTFIYTSAAETEAQSNDRLVTGHENWVQTARFPHLFRLGEFSSISNSAKGVSPGGLGMTDYILTSPGSSDLRVSDPRAHGVPQIKTPGPEACSKGHTCSRCASPC